MPEYSTPLHVLSGALRSFTSTASLANGSLPILTSRPIKRSDLQSKCSLRRASVFVEAFLMPSMERRSTSAVSLVSTSLLPQRLLCLGVKAAVGCFAAIHDAEASLRRLYRLFLRCCRHPRCEGFFTAILGAKTPVGCFATFDVVVILDPKASSWPSLARRLLSAVSPPPLRASWCKGSFAAILDAKTPSVRRLRLHLTQEKCSKG